MRIEGYQSENEDSRTGAGLATAEVVWKELVSRTQEALLKMASARYSLEQLVPDGALMGLELLSGETASMLKR
jgi:hypothetical protein